MVAFVGSGVMARCIYSIFTVNYHGQAHSARERDLPGRLRVVARAGERVARVRHLVRAVLVRDSVRAVQEEDRLQGLAAVHDAHRSQGPDVARLHGMKSSSLRAAGVAACLALVIVSRRLRRRRSADQANRQRRPAPSRRRSRVATRRGRADAVAAAASRHCRAPLDRRCRVTRAAASGARSSCRSRAATRSSRRMPTT